MKVNIHQRVNILPISEQGTVHNIRQDDRGEDIIEVKRDSDGEIHLCREVEIEPVIPEGPPPGTWAFTARLMAETAPPDEDFDWDAWKDEMKEEAYQRDHGN
jgi:hypothetical protein